MLLPETRGVSRMEDSGVTSFSSSGSVDISLDALDISANPNDSATSCKDSLELPTAAMPVKTADSEENADLMHSPGSVSKAESISSDQMNNELHR